MPTWVWIVVALAVAGLAYAALALLRRFEARPQRSLRDFLRSEALNTAGSMPPGPIQIEGTCEANGVLTAPLSGRDCIGYTLEVSTFCADTDGGHHWDLSLIDVLAPFSLALPDARVEVNGQPHWLWLTTDITLWRDVPRRALPVELQNRILADSRARYASDHRLDLVPEPEKELRITERLLLPGTRVLVIGEACPGSRTAAGDLESRIGPRQGMPLVVVDETKANVVERVSRRRVTPLLLEKLSDLFS